MKGKGAWAKHRPANGKRWLINVLTGFDSSACVLLNWGLVFLYYSFLIQFLFLLIKEKKFKLFALFITVFVILHGMSTYWIYLKIKGLFQ